MIELLLLFLIQVLIGMSLVRTFLLFLLSINEGEWEYILYWIMFIKLLHLTGLLQRAHELRLLVSILRCLTEYLDVFFILFIQCLIKNLILWPLILKLYACDWLDLFHSFVAHWVLFGRCDFAQFLSFCTYRKRDINLHGLFGTWLLEIWNNFGPCFAHYLLINRQGLLNWHSPSVPGAIDELSTFPI